MVSHLYPDILLIAKEAAQRIMQHYAPGVAVERKDDNTPVTIADLEANTIIVNALAKLTPDIPIISEENAESDNVAASKSSRFWLVDPLDGTKSFIKGTGEFTVNIALIKNGTPVYGVVYLPAQNLGYYTDAAGKAYRQKGEEAPVQIRTRNVPEEGYVVVASLSHRTPETDAYVKTLPKVQRFTAASSSMKFCLVAEGEADIYPRFGRTMEWDTAAGHAVLLAAGGKVEKENGQRLLYGKPGLDNPNFIAWGVAAGN